MSGGGMIGKYPVATIDQSAKSFPAAPMMAAPIRALHFPGGGGMGFALAGISLGQEERKHFES